MERVRESRRTKTIDKMNWRLFVENCDEREEVEKTTDTMANRKQGCHEENNNLQFDLSIVAKQLLF